MSKQTSKSSSKPLYRSETNRVIGGVAGGLGEYFGIDPTIIRILFVLITIWGGSGVLLYIILWIVIPSESNVGASRDQVIKDNVKDIEKQANGAARKAEKFANESNRGIWGGIILLLLGVAFLMSNFGFFHAWNVFKFWPIILIIVGIILLINRHD